MCDIEYISRTIPSLPTRMAPAVFVSAVFKLKTEFRRTTPAPVPFVIAHIMYTAPAFSCHGSICVGAGMIDRINESGRRDRKDPLEQYPMVSFVYGSMLTSVVVFRETQQKHI